MEFSVAVGLDEVFVPPPRFGPVLIVLQIAQHNSDVLLTVIMRNDKSLDTNIKLANDRKVRVQGSYHGCRCANER